MHYFGDKYVPIICINPVLGRANDKALNRECKCQKAN